MPRLSPRAEARLESALRSLSPASLSIPLRTSAPHGEQCGTRRSAQSRARRASLAAEGSALTRDQLAELSLNALAAPLHASGYPGSSDSAHMQGFADHDASGSPAALPAPRSHASSRAFRGRLWTPFGPRGGAELSTRTRGTCLTKPVPLIGATGFEPATFRPPAECATRLRHAPWLGSSLRSRGRSREERATGIEPASFSLEG